MSQSPSADLSRVSAHVAGAELPAGAPHQVSQPLASDAGRIAVATNPRTGESYAREDWHTMSPAQRAKHNERELAPLVARGPIQGGVAEAVDAVAEGKLDPFYANLKARQAEAPLPLMCDEITPSAVPAQYNERWSTGNSRPTQTSKQVSQRWHRVSRAPR